MAYDYSDLVKQAKNWAENVVNENWLTEAEVHSLLNDDLKPAQALFDASEESPLVVAFLGGTGVGKSTLLNRLAAKNIAKTGVVRPTSKEVTLFHHADIHINQLPAGFPLEKIRVDKHFEEKNRRIIWMDMPDFDSTEQSNQRLVLDWLPHIDVLIYVVSPERYRDNKAWQLLLAEGGKHAWVFVLNQSDRAQAEQYDDFIQQLNKAGFNQPLVYQSCCIKEDIEASVDEFLALQSMMQKLATQKTIKQLAVRSDKVRKLELIQELNNQLNKLGKTDKQVKQLNDYWQGQWQNFELLLREALALPMQQLAQNYALNSTNLSKQSEHSLWDTWAQTRFMDSLDSLILQVDSLGLPVLPIKNSIEPIRSNIKTTIQDYTLWEVRKSLIKPGNKLQRAILKIAAIAEIILPISAMAWVMYQAFIHFYKSSLMENPQYLGADFAINSVVLIAIVWLFPYFLQKKLTPSLEKAASKGLKRGLEKSLQIIDRQVLSSIENYEVQRQHCQQQLVDIIESCQQEELDKGAGQESSELSRLLLP
jgi:GTPase Era involved in 16S rRNA processing